MSTVSIKVFIDVSSDLAREVSSEVSSGMCILSCEVSSSRIHVSIGIVAVAISLGVANTTNFLMAQTYSNKMLCLM